MSSVFDAPPEAGQTAGFVNPFAHLARQTQSKGRSGAMRNTTSASGHEVPLHQRLSPTQAHGQPDCPLFRILPAEIRNHIFSEALIDYEDPAASQKYAKDSCWARPSYSAPRRTDTALLRTCRAVYMETWFLPFMLKEQTHWVTSRERAPPDYNVDTSPIQLRTTVEAIKKQHKQPTVEINSLRIFTQMFILEGHEVAKLLESVPDLAFRRLCITIRHADFWFWEDDQPLRFEGLWIERLCRALPATVREVVIEMETVKRKSSQLDEIANQMAQRWHFRTKDERLLFADATPNSHEVSRWQGSSSWHNQRWIRDEVSEGVIEYYVGAVRFRPKHAIEKAGGTLGDAVLRASACANLVDSSWLRLHIPNARRMTCDRPSIPHDTDDQPHRRVKRRRRRRMP